MTVFDFPSKALIAPDAARDIARGARLSAMYGREIGPVDVAKALVAAKVKYVLVGAHAANGYSSTPRTTVDVDIIASRSDQAKNALHLAFPHLTIEEHPFVVRFMDSDHEAIDVIKAGSNKLFSEVMKHSRSVTLDQFPVTVATLEAILALKFQAMVTISRKIADRMQDATDFMRVVEANATIDLPLLETLAELAFTGGGVEILRHVKNARAGKRLDI